MSVLAPTPQHAPPPARAPLHAVRAPRRSRLPAAFLAVTVAVGTVVQSLLAWTRPTPGYFPDEYLYAELGRSLAEGAGPLVRDGAAHFAPLLYPLVTAPVWLLGDVATAYRGVQTLNALLMSLAAIPVYLIGRQLLLGTPLSLACAGLAVAAPPLLYSSWVMAEPIAYPLALGALACAVALLDRPTPRLQLAFLALAFLAAFARIQLVAIPLCYLVAVLAVGLRRRGLRALVRGQRLAVGVPGGGAAVGLVAGLSGHFGYYPSFTYVQIGPLDAVQNLGANALVLAYSAGWVLVPGALLGLALAVARPRVAGELGFGALSAAFLGALLLQASLYGDTAHVQERYVVYAVPLLVLAFARYAQRGWPLLRAHTLLVAALALAAALVPLSGYAAAQGSAQSLLLSAHQGAALALGDVSLASLAFALGATGLALATLAVAWRRPSWATPAALGATLGAFALLGAAAYSFYDVKRAILRDAMLPANVSWVDDSGVGETTLLLMPLGARADAHSTLFWNRSVDRVALFGGAEAPDTFVAGAAETDDAGRLLVDGRRLSGPLLADVHGTWVELRDAARGASGPTKVLWRPRGQAQLALAMFGRFYDGAVAAEGGLKVWPRVAGGELAGWIELELGVAPGVRPSTLRVTLPDGRIVAATPSAGRRELVRVPVCSRGAWTASFAADATGLAHGGRVGPLSTPPRFVPDAAACA